MKIAGHFHRVGLHHVDVRRVLATGGLTAALGAAAYFSFSDLLPKPQSMPALEIADGQEVLPIATTPEVRP